MPSLAQAQVTWTGFAGAPGVSTFYWEAGGGVDLAALHSFIDGIKSAFPTGVTAKFPSTGVTIDEASGDVTGIWTDTAPADVVGAVPGSYSVVTGLCFNWTTGVYTAGRQLRGKTFIVPCAPVVFGSNGLVVPSTITAFETEAAALYAGPNPIRVYSRKNGVSAGVVDSDVSPKPAVLRSRRD